MWKRLWAPVAAPVAVFWDAVLGRRLLAPVDGYFHDLPLHVIVARAWRGGHIPVWDPFVFSGFPLLATSQPGVFYPPNALFLFAAPQIANNLTIVLHFVVAGVGAFLLARHLCHDDAGATVAAVAFGLGSFFFAHVGHQPMIASASWLPWALFGFELVRERVSPGRVAIAAGAIGLCAVAGHSQILFLVLAVVVAYAAGLTIVEWRSARARPLVLALAVVAGGAALGAVQLVPTAAILHATDRSRLSYADATSYSLPRSHAPLLAFPYLFGNPGAVKPFDAPYKGDPNLTELTGYPGLAALALAVAGFSRWRRDRRVLVLVALGAATFVVAFGAATPVGRLVYALPIYGQFRAWARYLVVTDLVIALLAAHGVAHLRARVAAERGRAISRAAVFAGLVVIAALGVPHIPGVAEFVVRGSARVWALALPTSAAVLAVGACAAFGRAPRLAAWALVVIVALDGAAFGAFYEWRSKSPPVAAMRADLRRDHGPGWGPVADAPGGIDRYLYASSASGYLGLFADITAAKGLRSANGFDPLSPKDYQRAVGGMTYFGVVAAPSVLWSSGSHLLDLLRITTVLVDPATTVPPPGPDAIVRDPTPVPGTRLVRYAYRPSLPDAFLVGAVRVASRPAVVARIEQDATFDPRAEALLERGHSCAPCGALARAAGSADAAPVGTVAGERWGTSTVALDVTAARGGLLVVSQAWFPGWQATIDGQRAPVVRADGLLEAVPVAAGRHHVELVYRAPGLRAGAAITVAALLAIGGWAAADVVVRRRAGGRRAEARSRAG